jgi:integrase/recombinase XerC
MGEGTADMDRMQPVALHLGDLAMMNRRPGTIYQRGRALARLERKVGPALECSAGDLRAYVADSCDSAEYRSATISHLRGFYRWATDEGLIDVDPSARLHRPRLARRLPRPMSECDLGRAIRAASEPIRTFLGLGAFAGLRACEIAQLRGEHIGEHLIVIAESKGGDTTTVPIAAPLRPFLVGLPRVGWCFPGGPRAKGPHISAGQVSKRTNQYLREAGIAATFHATRHRYGTQVYRATGRDLRMTQELMRHRSPVSTAIYTYVEPGEMRTASRCIARSQLVVFVEAEMLHQCHREHPRRFVVADARVIHCERLIFIECDRQHAMKC